MVIIGGYPLSAFGWTSQNHLLCEVAVPPGMEMPEAWRAETGFLFLERSPARIRALLNWAVPGVLGPADLPMVQPVMALAEAILAEREYPAARSWRAGAEDLDPDAVETSALPDLERAMISLGATPELIQTSLARYAAVLDPECGTVPPIYHR